MIELDRDLAARLREHGQLDVIESDVLKVDFAALAAQPAPAPLRVVGNLPYNISTPILFHLLGFAHRIADQHFMLQKEVIDRMVARPATSDYGRLSVMLQWRYEMENVLFVPPESFDPPPRVDSAVVRMVPLRAAAGGRRRRCSARSCRSPSASAASCCATRWASGWRQHGFAGSFDTQRRAEEVPVAEYVALAQPSARAEHERKARSADGLLRSTGAARRQAAAQPVTRVEGAAHAQRQWRHVDQLVGRHLLCRRVGVLTVDAGAPERPLVLRSLVRPFCLAGVCRTGYRKE